MTIDERLEKLVERHEALTQNVELLTLESRQHSRKLDTVVDAIRDFVSVVRAHEHRVSGLGHDA